MNTAAHFRSFFKAYLNAIDAGDAALFAGAGLSRPSGIVDWKELMRELADEVGLSVDRETDLIAVAQYHRNFKGNRAALNEKLLAEFTKDAKPSPNHRLIASLPIRSIWTTNYDTLIEDSFRDAQKRPDVKSSQPNLSQSYPRRDVTIYKMHGDVSQPQDAVLTKEDYELYSQTRGLFIEKLQGDLVSKTFLFLGFSFSDPNIDYVFGRLHVFLGQNPREHFCVMRRPGKPSGSSGKKKADYEYETRKFELRVADLKRYGVTTLAIDDYSEITDILAELNRRGHRKDVFVSGSAEDFSPLGRKRIESLARKLGEELIGRDYNLVSGFGLGIGSAVIMGATQALYDSDSGRQDGRMLLRPFPQVMPQGMTESAFKTRYREDCLSQSGAVVFICGNKSDSTSGVTVEATGVLEEFRIAEAMGLAPIPLGQTGHAALTIWNEVKADLGKYFKTPAKVKPHFDVLGNAASTDSQIVKAVFAILELVNAV